MSKKNLIPGHAVCKYLSIEFNANLMEITYWLYNDHTFFNEDGEQVTKPELPFNLYDYYFDKEEIIKISTPRRMRHVGSFFKNAYKYGYDEIEFALVMDKGIRSKKLHKHIRNEWVACPTLEENTKISLDEMTFYFVDEMEAMFLESTKYAQEIKEGNLELSLKSDDVK